MFTVLGQSWGRVCCTLVLGVCVYGFAPSLCGLSKLAVSKHAVPVAVAVVQAGTAAWQGLAGCSKARHTPWGEGGGEAWHGQPLPFSF